MTDPLALRIPAVAAALGVDDETVRRWLQAGDLPGRKVGGIWLVGVASLEAWLSLDRGEEAADAGRGEHLPTEVGRAAGRADQHRPRVRWAR